MHLVTSEANKVCVQLLYLNYTSDTISVHILMGIAVRCVDIKARTTTRHSYRKTAKRLPLSPTSAYFLTILDLRCKFKDM